MRQFFVSTTIGLLILAATGRAGEASDAGDAEEPDVGRLDVAARVYEHVLDAWLRDAGGTLTILMYKGYSPRVPDDLEVAVSIHWVLTGPGLATETFVAEIVQAEGDLLRDQILDRVIDDRIEDEATILSKLHVKRDSLTEAQCPALRQIWGRYRAEWLRFALPSPQLEYTIYLHPRVIGVAIHDLSRSTAVTVVDADDPLFRWGLEAVRRVQSCVGG